jgi:hypothetical protein
MAEGEIYDFFREYMGFDLKEAYRNPTGAFRILQSTT